MTLKALIFDCDGVLVDTERDGHRVAFNRAFAQHGLGLDWSPQLYGELLQVAGGKERMRHYFDRYGWPAGVVDKSGFIQKLHLDKTRCFMQIIDSGELPLRPGIARIVDEALAVGLRLGVCSTSNIKSVSACVALLGDDRRRQFEFILAGDVVSRKKPDPEIYRLALEKLELSGAECMVIEDSRVGMLAALEAGINCLVTTSAYTAGEDFSGAAGVVAELGEGSNARVSLPKLQQMVGNNNN